MATITSAGIGSGLDINGLITKLIAAEGEPTTRRLDNKEAGLQAQLSGYGALKGALAEFQGALAKLKSIASFNSVSATVANPELFTATTTSIATAASYTLEVDELARGQRLASTGFSGVSDPVGTGTLSFQFGSFDGGVFSVNPAKAAKQITIGAGDSSLQGIRDAINRADVGVRASLVNDGSGYRLVLASKDSGAANSIKLTVSDDDGNGLDSMGLSRLAFDPEAADGNGKNLTETLTAKDAVVYVDGLRVTSASNILSGVIEGVTLNLLKAAPAAPTRLDLGRDEAAAAKSVGDFVSGYNALAKVINSLSSFDAKSPKQRGALLGDSMLRGVANEVRRVLGDAVPGLAGALRSLADIGISTQRDGTLALDGAKLQAALRDDFEGVGRLFATAGAPSDALIRYLSASDATQAGSYAVTITQLAARGSYSGAPAAGLTVDTSNDTFALRVDGVQSGTISLTQKVYASGSELAAELQSRINGNTALSKAGAAVTVSFQAGGFLITSDRYGSASKVEITSVDTDTAATLGLSVGAGTEGVDVAGTIGGAAATGSGQVLNGTGAATGLKLEVLGGVLGGRGTVDFGRGVAARLDKVLTGFLGAGGVLGTRTEGLSARIEGITQEREALGVRLDKLAERYRVQYTALDTLLAQLRVTSDFLTRQLASLQGASTQK